MMGSILLSTRETIKRNMKRVNLWEETGQLENIISLLGWLMIFGSIYGKRYWYIQVLSYMITSASIHMVERETGGTYDIKKIRTTTLIALVVGELVNISLEINSFQFLLPVGASLMIMLSVLVISPYQKRHNIVDGVSQQMFTLGWMMKSYLLIM